VQLAFFDLLKTQKPIDQKYRSVKGLRH